MIPGYPLSPAHSITHTWPDYIKTFCKILQCISQLSHYQVTKQTPGFRSNLFPTLRIDFFRIYPVCLIDSLLNALQLIIPIELLTSLLKSIQHKITLAQYTLVSFNSILICRLVTRHRAIA